MAKRTLYLLIFILIAALLAGCVSLAAYNPNATRHPDPTGTATQVLTTPTPQIPTPTPTAIPDWWVEPDALSGLKIEFWHPWTGKMAEVVAALVVDFNRSNPYGIRVTGRDWGGNSGLSGQVLNRAYLPELLMANPEQLAAWQAESLDLVDLAGYQNNPTYGIAEDDYYPVFRSGEGGILTSLPIQRSARVLFYNVTWAKELGFTTPPGTPEEFQEQACSAAEANRSDRSVENNGTGGWLWESDALTLASWFAAYGASLPESLESAYQFNNNNVVDAFTYLRSLLDSGCAWSGKTLYPYEIFAKRQALFISGSLQDIPSIKIAMPHYQSTDAWTILPYPGVNGEKNTITNGVNFAIPSSDPARQLAAWIFARWMLLPEQQVKLIQAGGTFPLSESAMAALESFSRQNTQWDSALDWIMESQPAPSSSSWVRIGDLLEDAGWQIAQPYVKLEEIPAVLGQLDEMITQLVP